MKKSRIAKFALLGASTLALAGTLSTSTYAWYVSAKKANTNTVTGSTVASQGGNSIGISTDGKKGTYRGEIQLGTLTANVLDPVITTDGTTFTTLAGADGSGKVYHIQFWLQATDTVNVAPKLTFVNTTTEAAMKPQANYGVNHVPTGVAASDPEFYAELLDALHVSQTLTKYTAWAADDANNKAPVALSTPAPVLNASPVAADTYIGVTKYSFADGTNVATAGAHDYYDEVSGDTALTDEQKTLFTDSATSIGIFELVANTPTKVDYYIWLDGADEQCFNACAGQSFSVAFEYTVQAGS